MMSKAKSIVKLVVTNHKFRRFPKVFSPCRAMSNLAKSRISQPEWVINQHGEIHFLLKENQAFEKFYSLQNTCESSEEWEEFLAAIKTDLPQSFRLNSSRPQTTKLLNQILQKMISNADDEELLSAKSWPKAIDLPSFPIVWQCSQHSRWDLKLWNNDYSKKGKISTTKLEKILHEFLTNQRACGNLSRQELVSMAPVFLLNIQPNHRILDMCSSPGSKSRHVLEIMHTKLAASTDFQIPTGFLVANEVDVTRLGRLSKNVRFTSSPCVVLTNHDGQNFPDFSINNETVKYDRIVCDVPCSGDGTIRKNPNIFGKKWSPIKGNQRHNLQYNIAERGMELLKVGGIMAYSSCSMNPIENEAVVSRLLRVSEGALELVDCSEMLPGFKYAPGFTNWKVFDANFNEYNSFDEVPTKLHLNQIKKPMFADPEFNQTQHLERCMRLLPHHNNDGGFFISLIRKIKPLPWETEAESRQNQGKMQEFLQQNEQYLSHKIRNQLKRELIGELYIPRKKKDKIRRSVNCRIRTWIDYKSKEVEMNCDNDAKIDSLLDFYGFNINPSLFFKVNGQIYLANKAVKNLIKESTKDHNIFGAGLKILVPETKTKSMVSHCITAEGRPLLSTFIKDQRKVKISREEMKLLLELENETISLDFEKQFHEKSVSKLTDILTQFGGIGPILIQTELNNGDIYEACGYLGDVKILLNISSEERYHGLLVLKHF